MITTSNTISALFPSFLCCCLDQRFPQGINKVNLNISHDDFGVGRGWFISLYLKALLVLSLTKILVHLLKLSFIMFPRY